MKHYVRKGTNYDHRPELLPGEPCWLDISMFVVKSSMPEGGQTKCSSWYPRLGRESHLGKKYQPIYCIGFLATS
jgi:hypothetical protein